MAAGARRDRRLTLREAEILTLVARGHTGVEVPARRPVAPVFRSKSEAEAIERANDTGFGMCEGSHHRMDDYVEAKYLCLGDILQ